MEKYTFKKNNQEYWFEYDEANAISFIEVLKKLDCYDLVKTLLKEGFELFAFEVRLKKTILQNIIFDNVINLNQKSENLTNEIINNLNNSELGSIVATLIAFLMNDFNEENTHSLGEKKNLKSTKSK
ncbi:MAG: hypothetical protein GY760_17020 [Deltaproteobacteria bacterium]|nr:hypothetical protein [Deltaproteobacteria bacterium]